MESYRLEIYSNEDIDLIEDIEEREEAQEAYEDEIEAVYQQLERDKNNSVEFEQITDNVFNITIDTYKDRFNDEIIESIEANIKCILEQKDIAGYSIENYQEA
ncbi:MAG: hypothetical protein ACRC7S_08895 [Cetobacterium sp.]